MMQSLMRFSGVLLLLAAGCTSNSSKTDAGTAACSTPARLDDALLPFTTGLCETTVVVSGTACPGHSVSISRDVCTGVPIISTVADARGRFAASVTARRGPQDFFAVDDQLPGSADCRAVSYTLQLQLSPPTQLDARWLTADTALVSGVVDSSLALDVSLSRDTSCQDDRNPVRIHLLPGGDGGFAVPVDAIGTALTISAKVEAAGRCPSPCITTDIHGPDAGVPLADAGTSSDAG